MGSFFSAIAPRVKYPVVFQVRLQTLGIALRPNTPQGNGRIGNVVRVGAGVFERLASYIGPLFSKLCCSASCMA